MIKANILTRCEHCDCECYLPAGEAEDYQGERYMRYEPRPRCRRTAQDRNKRIINAGISLAYTHDALPLPPLSIIYRRNETAQSAGETMQFW